MTDGATLLAHKGAKYVTREQLAEYIPPPATATFQPIGHKKLVDTLTEVMEFRGMHITREQFAVQNAKLFGTFDLEWMRMEEYGAAVCFQHSTDKSLAVKIGVGARVFLCDNLSMHAEMITVRKHTGKLQLDEEMDRAMYRYMQGFRRLQDDIRVRDNALIDDTRIKSLLYDIFEQKIVSPRLFPVIASDYAHVRDNNAVRTSAWWLENLITARLKTLQPAPRFRATARLAKFMASAFRNGYGPV